MGAPGVRASIGLSLLLGTAILLVDSARPIAASLADLVLIPLPEQWISFSADITHVSANEVTHGRFYRRGDGSTATVLRAPLGDVVTIRNLQTRSIYGRLRNGRPWTRRPLVVAEADLPPLGLALPRDRSRKVAEREHDREVWEVTGLAGGSGVTRLAPDLNGFAIFRKRGFGAEPSGYIEVYQNIQVGEPPTETFLPPPDAAVEDVTQ